MTTEHPTAFKLELYADELKLILMALNSYKDEHPESTLLQDMDHYYLLHEYISDAALNQTVF